MYRATAVVVSLITGYSAVPAEESPVTPEEHAGYLYAAELAQDLVAFMDEEGITYIMEEETPGRWAVPFDGENGDWYVVVSVDPEYVVLVIEVFEIPENVEPSFYLWVLETNFDINQAKFGINDGKLYFNVDAPTRLLDRPEYLDTIRAMVNYVDGIYPEILERSGGGPSSQ